MSRPNRKQPKKNIANGTQSDTHFRTQYQTINIYNNALMVGLSTLNVHQLSAFLSCNAREKSTSTVPHQGLSSFVCGVVESTRNLLHDASVRVLPFSCNSAIKLGRCEGTPKSNPSNASAGKRRATLLKASQSCHSLNALCWSFLTFFTDHCKSKSAACMSLRDPPDETVVAATVCDPSFAVCLSTNAVMPLSMFSVPAARVFIPRSAQLFADFTVYSVSIFALTTCCNHKVRNPKTLTFPMPLASADPACNRAVHVERRLDCETKEPSRASNISSAVAQPS